MKFKLNPDFVEHIHDVLIGVFLPFDQPIIPGEYRDRGLIESAVSRPFQTAHGVDIWPSPQQKAAALFHSLACNHCFLNGNKRTAVMALDVFLAANGFLLAMSPEQIYELATATASANAEGKNVEDVMMTLSKNYKHDHFYVDSGTARHPKAANG